MLVSLKWLADYVDLPGDLDPVVLADRLTMASAEVEGIRRSGEWDAELVTVGEVLAVEPHPDADRLRLATVRYAPGAEPLRVVCGAPNLRAGQRVAFARAGAVLTDARSGERQALKAGRIRGVESAGMVLSEAELGLSRAHEGILELPDTAPVGMALAAYLGDTVLDVHTWPNRPDTMGIVGIARELAAILDLPLREPAVDVDAGGDPVAGVARVTIDEPDLCARYLAAVVEGVTVGPSPAWLQERLRAAGQRPISNIVDVTNYVMLELGQPLHAFDLDALTGGITVRRARPGEVLRTLDGEDRSLDPEMLVIADERGAVALAGVMGGAATEVGPGTTRVLLEAARFDPVSVRRTSHRLRLRSEASSRFERGLSPELAAHAIRRATRLLLEVAGGTARAGVVDVYPRPWAPAPVTVTRERLDRVIGVHVPDDEVHRGLAALGCAVAHDPAAGGGGTFTVTPPWWRTDLTIPDDLCEEVVRLAGYDRLPARTPAGRIPPFEESPLLDARDRLLDALVAAGLTEVATYSLTTPEVLARVLPPPPPDREPLRLLNTLSSDHQVLRPTLRHSLLETVERNVRAGQAAVAIVEAHRVFLPRAAADPAGPLPDERVTIAGALAGRRPDRWGAPTAEAFDLFDLKGVLEAASAALGLVLAYEAAEEHSFLPGRTARLLAGGDAVGVLGEVHPESASAFGLDQPVVLFELDVAALLPHLPGARQPVPPSRFPAVEQDLAVVLPADVPAEAVRQRIAQSRLVGAVRLFDEYRGDQLPPGRKSLAFSIRYQAPDRTLQTEDAQREQARILARLERELDAEQRA